MAIRARAAWRASASLLLGVQQVPCRGPVGGQQSSPGTAAGAGRGAWAQPAVGRKLCGMQLGERRGKAWLRGRGPGEAVLGAEMALWGAFFRIRTGSCVFIPLLQQREPRRQRTELKLPGETPGGAGQGGAGWGGVEPAGWCSGPPLVLLETHKNVLINFQIRRGKNEHLGSKKMIFSPHIRKK